MLNTVSGANIGGLAICQYIGTGMFNGRYIFCGIKHMEETAFKQVTSVA